MKIKVSYDKYHFSNIEVRLSTTLLNYNEICVRYARALIKVFKDASEQDKCLKMYKKLLDLKKKSVSFEKIST